ncbi:hypothetical protein HYV49_04775 [Candidatus Pacearchaeota archaeon]|nr:hypothetical protein [Candidatus Pacearchaeota archaeon]
MAKIKLHGAEKIANAPLREIYLDEIKLDPNNVRFSHIPKKLTDKEIEKILWGEKDTLELYKQILSAREIYEEPVLNSELIVIEGNRRIVCLRKLKEEANKEELLDMGIPQSYFDKVRCKVLPKETLPQEIDIYLATIHVKGKKTWKAFNKAKHLFNLHELRGFSYEDISKNVGMGKATVIRQVEVYDATDKYGKNYSDKDKEWFNKFTYFDELFKRKDLKEFKKEVKNIEKFGNWVYHTKFNNDVRKVRQLARILQDKDAFKEFEKKDFNAAMEILGSKDPSINSSEFKKIKDTIDVIKNFSRKEISKTINDDSRLILLNSLKKEVDNLIKDIKSMKKTS